MCSDRIRRRAVSSLFTWLLMVKLHLDDYSGGKVRAPLDLRCTSVYHPQLLPVPCTSLRVAATISVALSPPEPESPRPRHHPVPRIGDHLPQLRVTELDSCRVAVSSTRVTLRSTASAPLLQSPVQRAGRAIGFPDAEQHAAARNHRKERSLSIITSYNIRASAFGVDFCRAGDAHIAARFAPVAPQGALSSLDEHGLLSGRFGQLARHGAPVYGAWRLCN